MLASRSASGAASVAKLKKVAAVTKLKQVAALTKALTKPDARQPQRHRRRKFCERCRGRRVSASHLHT